MPAKMLMERDDQGPTLDLRAINGASPAEPGITGILGMLWRRRVVFVLVALLCAAGGVAAISALPRSYRSDALIALDTRAANYTDMPAVLDTSPISGELNWVRSELLVLGSDGLALGVIKALDLTHDPEFMPHVSLTQQLLERAGLAGPPAALTPDQATEFAIAAYRKRLGVFNDGKSFILSASFEAASPGEARKILTKHIELYLSAQMQVKQAAISRAATWLTAELARLDTKIKASEAQLQTFRDTSRLVRSTGETVAGRQLTEATSQLAAARNDLAGKVARLKQLNEGVYDTAVLSMQPLPRLREQESASVQHLAELQQRFGAGYPQTQSAQAAVTAVRAQIASELSRLRAAAANDVAVARANAASLDASLTQMERNASVADRSEVTADQLNRDIDSDRRIYAELLTRSKQVAIQRELQDASARVISTPSLPLDAAFPKRGLLFPLAIVAGFVVSAVLVLLLELLRGHSHSLTEIEASVGLVGLAVVPSLGRSRSGRLPQVPKPLSYGATALQSLHNSVAFQNGGRIPGVVMLTSALPGEGKSTLASLMAGVNGPGGGGRVLIIDADLRRSGLTRMLGASRAPLGIVGLLTEGGALMDAIVPIRPGVDLLPVEGPCSNPYALLSSPRMRMLMATARASYDSIIVDTPPLGAVEDALAVAPLVDKTVLVARWGYTPSDAIAAALRRLRLAQVDVAGVVLNRAKPGKYGSGDRDIDAFRVLSMSYYPSK